MVRRGFAHYAEVKEHNKSRILRTISSAPTTRIDLARTTGLSPATITALVKELMAAGLVRESEALESMGGRRPVLLEFNPDARRAVGLSISQKRIQAAVVNLDGTILQFRERPLDSTFVDRVMEELVDLTRTVVREAQVEWDRVAGVGVAVPGTVDSGEGTVLLSTVMGWRELPLGRMLTQALAKPVRVQRNGNAAALAEAYFGRSEVQTDLLYLNLSTGIGAGIVLQGSLYAGLAGRAGEAGHMVLDPNGPVCLCGNRGCLEALASGPAIAARAAEAARAGQSPRLLELAKGEPAALTAREVAQAAREGDPVAVALLEQTGRWIGLAIAGLVNLLDIRAVALGGGLSQAGEVLLQPIVKSAREAVLPFEGTPLTIWPSALWPRAGVIGAATLVIEEVLRHGEMEVRQTGRSSRSMHQSHHMEGKT